MSDIHKCSGGLQIALVPLDKQTAIFNSPHNYVADEFSYGFSYFVWYVEVKMAPMDVIWLFSVLT